MNKTKLKRILNKRLPYKTRGRESRHNNSYNYNSYGPTAFTRWTLLSLPIWNFHTFCIEILICFFCKNLQIVNKNLFVNIKTIEQLNNFKSKQVFNNKCGLTVLKCENYVFVLTFRTTLVTFLSDIIIIFVLDFLQI